MKMSNNISAYARGITQLHPMTSF